MKFIKITNSATEVNRLSLEKLGLSTKRDLDETIGQFGSGVKFAPIAAIRKGMRWIFTGTDKKGDYILEYVIKEDEGIPCVFYQYQDYEKPSSFTADAGLLSWEEPFQILREVIANAIDQAVVTSTDWSMTLVDESDIKHTDGEFSVFITADESVMDVYNNFDKYFSVYKTPIYNVPGLYTGFKIYEPVDEYLRIYCKGILVYSTNREKHDEDAPGISSLYDYEFNNLELNEERTVKSIYDVNYRIASALSRIEDKPIVMNLIEQILSDKSNSSYEFNALSSYALGIQNDESKAVWQNVFETNYPKHVIVDKVNANLNNLVTIKGKGFTPIVVDNDNKYNFLIARGIPSAINTFGEKFKYDYTMNIDSYELLMEAVSIVVDVFDDAHIAYPSSLGVVKNNDNLSCAMTLNYNGEIEDKIVLVSEQHINEASLEDLVATLIHELDHFMTGADDGDMTGRAFRSLADKRLAQLAIQTFKLKNGLSDF